MIAILGPYRRTQLDPNGAWLEGWGVHTWLQGGAPVPLLSCLITWLTIWFLVDITIINGIYKPTNITGVAPPCSNHPGLDHFDLQKKETSTFRTKRSTKSTCEFMQSFERFHMGVSINGGTPKWMVCKGKSHLNGWFRGTPILGNIHRCFQGVPRVARVLWTWLWQLDWSLVQLTDSPLSEQDEYRPVSRQTCDAIKKAVVQADSRRVVTAHVLADNTKKTGHQKRQGVNLLTTLVQFVHLEKMFL